MESLYLYMEVDMIGIALLSVLFFSRKGSGEQTMDQHFFDAILVITSAILLLDTILNVVNGNQERFLYIINRAFNSIYAMLTPLVGLFWLIYCKYKATGSMRTLKKYLPLYSLPFVLNIVVMILNAYTGLLFYVDDSNLYHRGLYFGLSIFINFIYVIGPIYVCLKKAHSEKMTTLKKDYYYMVAFMLPPVFGAVLQLVFDWAALIWIGVAFSLLLIYLNLQNRMISLDMLTQTNNRWQLNRYLDQKLHNLNGQLNLFAFMIDMDGFKKINDDFGHAEGDWALIKTANLLKRCCADSHDFLARLGGDEFVIICERRTLEEAELTKRKILDVFENYNASSDKKYQLSLSIGVAEFDPEFGIGDADTLLSAADDQMYRIKQKRHCER